MGLVYRGKVGGRREATREIELVRQKKKGDACNWLEPLKRVGCRYLGRRGTWAEGMIAWLTEVPDGGGAQWLRCQ